MRLAILSLTVTACSVLAFCHQQTDTCSASPLAFKQRFCQPFEERHVLEHSQLLQKIDRRHGKWNKHHPRWGLLEALYGFERYAELVGAEIERFRDLYGYVPKEHKRLLERAVEYERNFEVAKGLVERNAEVCRGIVEEGLRFYGIGREELDGFIQEIKDVGKSKEKAMRLRVSDALKHVVRDWAIEGENERTATFPYILDALRDDLSSSQGEYKVLIPGAGLGRLAHEIAELDENVVVTSNEKDAYMNLAYRYITSVTRTSTIYPFIDSWSHLRTRKEASRAVKIPDAAAPLEADSLLVGGDFTTSFPPSLHETYDAIATLFFIDTARNIVEYLEIIHKLLKPNGLWINVGPLLYGTAPFVQLSLDELLRVTEEIGFEFIDRKEEEVLYNFNASALYRNAYMAQYWVARKKTAEKGKGRGSWWW